MHTPPSEDTQDEDQAEAANQDSLDRPLATIELAAPAAHAPEAAGERSADASTPADAADTADPGDATDAAPPAVSAVAADAAESTETADIADSADSVGAAKASDTAPAGASPGSPASPDTAATADFAAPPADLSPTQCSARLGQLFPALFRLQQPLPLKLRIQADIQARAPGVFTRKSLSAFLHRYTTGTPYLLALTRQTQRFDLEGQPAGDLATEHREAATTEMARRRAIVEDRRAAEQAAQRDAQAAQRQQHEADQQGRRERAMLLRAFESSTLTRANFCALKGLDESSLDTLLAQARQEAAERPAWAEDRPPRRDDGQRPGPGQHRPPRPQGTGGARDRKGGRPAGQPSERAAERANEPPNVRPNGQPNQQPNERQGAQPRAPSSGRPGNERGARGPSRTR